MKTTCINAVLLLAMLIFSAGCLVMHQNSIDESGVRVSPSTLDQVEPGRTSEAWLIATLGEPTSRRKVDDRTSILRYNYTRESSSGGAVFLIFAGQSSKTESTTTFFEITDSIVTRHWIEQ